jgi:hypothetical protein
MNNDKILIKYFINLMMIWIKRWNEWNEWIRIKLIKLW